MRTVQILILLLSLSACSSSQVLVNKELTGVWQNETKEIASGWLDTYQFFDDSHFIFNLNQYDEARRVLSLKGHYRIKGDTLFFKVDSTVELVGGYFERSTFTSIHGSWSLSGNVTKKEIKLPDTEEQYAIIKRCNEEKQIDCILIDESIYYKMSSKPEDYK